MCPAVMVAMAAIATVVTVQKRVQTIAREVAANRLAKGIHRHRQRFHRKSCVNNRNIQNHHEITVRTQHPAIMIWVAVHKHQVNFINHIVNFDFQTNRWPSIYSCKFHIDTNVVIPTSANATAKDVLGQKFTTSNFTESVVVSSDPVFGSGSNSKPPPNVQVVKKRKLEPNKSNSNTNDDIIR